MRSYTQLRKQREEFRKRLVNLIVNAEEGAEPVPDEIPSAEEREILRYYYYIRHGVDTIHVAPLDQAVLDRVSKNEGFFAKTSVKKHRLNVQIQFDVWLIALGWKTHTKKISQLNCLGSLRSTNFKCNG